MAEYKKDESEIGALWEKSGAKGTYLTGTVNGARVVVFRNTDKKSEKSPDWRAYVPKAAPTERSSQPSVEDTDAPF